MLVQHDGHWSRGSAVAARARAPPVRDRPRRRRRSPPRRCRRCDRASTPHLSSARPDLRRTVRVCVCVCVCLCVCVCVFVSSSSSMTTLPLPPLPPPLPLAELGHACARVRRSKSPCVGMARAGGAPVIERADAADTRPAERERGEGARVGGERDQRARSRHAARASGRSRSPSSCHARHTTCALRNQMNFQLARARSP